MYSSCPLFDKLCRVANRTNNWHNYFYKRAELKERKQISGGYKNATCIRPENCLWYFSFKIHIILLNVSNLCSKNKGSLSKDLFIFFLSSTDP